MSNHRTILSLKPYKGANITRIHKNGCFIYVHKNAYGELIHRSSLKELKKVIDDIYSLKKAE